MNNLKKSNKEFLKEVYLLVKDEYIFLENIRVQILKFYVSIINVIMNGKLPQIIL